MEECEPMHTHVHTHTYTQILKIHFPHILSCINHHILKVWSPYCHWWLSDKFSVKGSHLKHTSDEFITVSEI
jgi:hypothetical protein